MQELIDFIYRRRAFFCFAGLQAIALWLVFGKNTYQHVAYLSTANRVNGGIYEMSSGTKAYFGLKEANSLLLEENQQLRNTISKSTFPYEHIDTIQSGNVLYDSTYVYTAGTVINNSVGLSNNYITIDKGLKDGIAPGMGIISYKGVVGKVKACSENYAVGYSLLHSNMPISARINSSGHLCTVKWDGQNYLEARALYVPMHIPIEKGDSIVTSGFNAIFPPGVLLGIVESHSKPSDDVFQRIRLKLSVDFSNISHLYFVEHRKALERDSLEQEAIN